VSGIVEHQGSEFAGAHLHVGAERDRDLLVVPLHHVNGELDDLLHGEIAVQVGAQFCIDQPWLRHDRIGESQSNAVVLGKITRFVTAHLVDGWFIETLLLSDRQANTQSSVAVVVHGASHPHQFRRDRIEMLQSHHGGLPFAQRSEDVRVGVHPRCDPA